MQLYIETHSHYIALPRISADLQPSVATPGVCRFLEGGIHSAHLNTILHDFYTELVLQKNKFIVYTTTLYKIS